MQERTLSLIGKERYNNLARSRVLVVGIGGVGGYATEMLVRAGVGSITIIDGDKVDETNINRQIIALRSTVGRDKVDVMRERIADINPDCTVHAICDRVTADNIGDILSTHYDYIIDAIDSVGDKVALITEAKNRNMNIVSAMGAGGKYRNVSFNIADIYSTKYDKLARKMRRLIKDAGITSLDVCYSESESVVCDGVIGSISYAPSLAGITIAQHVICRLMESNND